MRVILGLAIWLGTCLPVLAEPIWFVSLASINQGKEVQYEKFIEAVTPIWKRHGMSVVTRITVIDGFSGSDLTPPQEIAILKAETRAGFRAYIDDADYQAIKTQRTDAANSFVVLEGKAVSTEGLEYFAKNPMVAVVLNTEDVSSKESLDIAISLAGQVKGPVGEYLQAVKRVHVYPLSFDDNPTGYVREGSDAAFFVGERVAD